MLEDVLLLLVSEVLLLLLLLLSEVVKLLLLLLGEVGELERLRLLEEGGGGLLLLGLRLSLRLLRLIGRTAS